MLEAVDILNERGESLSLSLESHVEGYLVADIQGLDPVKASLSSTKSAGRDGTQFQNAQRDDRNIVLTVGLVTDYVTNTVRGLRQALYGFVPPKSKVRLRFHVEGESSVEIWGVVEGFESTLFSAEPQVEISIICNDPDFSDVAPTVVSGNSVATSVMSTLTYTGTSEVGFKLLVTVNRTIAGFTLYYTDSAGKPYVFEIKLAMVAGQKLEISSVEGNKYIRLNGSTSVLYAASVNVEWPKITKGPNTFRVQVAGAALPYTLTYIGEHVGL